MKWSIHYAYLVILHNLVNHGFANCIGFLVCPYFVSEWESRLLSWNKFHAYVSLDTERLYTEMMQTICSDHGKQFTWEIKVKQMGRKIEEAAKILIGRL